MSSARMTLAEFDWPPAPRALAAVDQQRTFINIEPLFVLHDFYREPKRVVDHFWRPVCSTMEVFKAYAYRYIGIDHSTETSLTINAFSLHRNPHPPSLQSQC